MRKLADPGALIAYARQVPPVDRWTGTCPPPIYGRYPADIGGCHVSRGRPVGRPRGGFGNK